MAKLLEINIKPDSSLYFFSLHEPSFLSESNFVPLHHHTVPHCPAPPPLPHRNPSVGAYPPKNGTGTVAGGDLDEDEEYERGHWGSKAEFILSCVGFSVSGKKGGKQERCGSSCNKPSALFPSLYTQI